MGGLGRLVLWDVDTQNDFFGRDFESNGTSYKPALGIPGSESIRENLRKIIQYTYNNDNWRIMGSVDAHTIKDKLHLAKWPIHCIKGTPGQLKIPETQLPETVFIPMKKLEREELEEILEKNKAVYFEKSELPNAKNADECNSCKVNPNIETMLDLVRPKLIILDGVALDFCVKEAYNYFKSMTSFDQRDSLNYRLGLVTDAIKEFNPEALSLYGRWKTKERILTNTEQVLAGQFETEQSSTEFDQYIDKKLGDHQLAIERENQRTIYEHTHDKL